MQLCGWTQVSVCKGASSSVLVPTLHKWIPYTAWSVWGFGGAGVSVFLERGSTQETRSQSAPCWMLPSWIHPLGAFGGEHRAMAPTWRPPAAPLVSQLATAPRSCSKWDPPSSQSKGLLPPEGLTCPLSSVFTPQREGGQSLILLCLHGLAGGRHKARGSLPMVSSLGDAAPNARDRG